MWEKSNFLTMHKSLHIVSFLFFIKICVINTPIVMSQSLSMRQQHLSQLAAYEAKGDLSGVEQIVNNALDNQTLTVNELKEALSHLYAYTGFPRSLNSLNTLQRVIQERNETGKTTIEGKSSTPLSPDYNALSQGTSVQTKLTGKPYNYTFAPSIDYYLKAHLFGDIFSQDILSFSDRELITISALSAIEGVEPQLKAHIEGSRRMGLSDTEIHAIPSVLYKNVGEIEGYRASKAIAEAFGEKFTDGKPINMIFPKGEFNAAYAQYFIGNSYLAPLLKEDLPMSNVTFEPRCRNNWHIHHNSNQILICVGGEGWYQEWGKPAQKLHTGDVVNIPAEVKHWHGATANSWFQHIAIATPNKNASNEWLEPVNDAEYDALEAI